jgi:hypothetical protein
VELSNVISLFELYEEFLYFSFGKTNGKDLYADYLCWVRATSEDREKILKDEKKVESLSRMEMAFNALIWITTQNEVGFYYKDLHSESVDLRLISQNILLKYRKCLFDNGGKLNFEAGQTGVIAMFDRSIMDVIKKESFQSTHFNHEFHTNDNKVMIDNICLQLLKNKDLINSVYKKDPAALTEKEIRRFCKDQLKIEISEHKATEILGIIRSN